VAAILRKPYTAEQVVGTIEEVLGVMPDAGR
jgi:hypothetical protein